MCVCGTLCAHVYMCVHMCTCVKLVHEQMKYLLINLLTHFMAYGQLMPTDHYTVLYLLTPRKRKLNTIKQRKLIELREAGVPDKYCAEVSRRITAPPPSFTMSGHH